MKTRITEQSSTGCF